MESPAANGQAVCPQRRSVRKPLPARAPPLRPQPVPPAGKTPLDCVFVCVWLPARGPATWARASNVPRLQAEGLELHAGGATCASPACGSSSCAPRRGAGGRHGKGRGGGSRVPVPVPDPVRAPRSGPGRPGRGFLSAPGSLPGSGSRRGASANTPRKLLGALPESPGHGRASGSSGRGLCAPSRCRRHPETFLKVAAPVDALLLVPRPLTPFRPRVTLLGARLASVSFCGETYIA